jgi:hypothetical protein
MTDTTHQTEQPEAPEHDGEPKLWYGAYTGSLVVVLARTKEDAIARTRALIKDSDHARQPVSHEQRLLHDIALRNIKEAASGVLLEQPEAHQNAVLKLWYCSADLAPAADWAVNSSSSVLAEIFVLATTKEEAITKTRDYIKAGVGVPGYDLEFLDSALETSMKETTGLVLSARLLRCCCAGTPE